MTVLRRLLLKLEAVWWMGRPSALIDTPLIVPAAWLAAPDTPADARMLAMMVAAVIAGALGNMVNDLLDEDKDQTTAPELPLPSGLLTRSQALVAFAVLLLAGFASVALASVTFEHFVAGAAVGFLCGFLVLLYSLVKEHGLLATVVIASAYACIPLGAWLVAGAGGSVIAPVLTFALLWGIAGNFQAALRDVDSDDQVGNRSIAVRIGPERTLALGAGVDVLASLCILWAAALEDRLQIAIPLVALFLAVLVATHRAAIARHTEKRAAGRAQRVRVMRAATLSRLGSQLVLIAVFSVPVALTMTVVVTVLLLLLIPGYEQRIIGGGLKEAMASGPGEAFASADRGPSPPGRKGIFSLRQLLGIRAGSDANQ